MPRQTISLTDPNHAWLQARVDSGEFKTHTEAVNDALRRVRESERMMETEEEIEFVRERIALARQQGTTPMTAEEIRDEVKEELRREGKL